MRDAVAEEINRAEAMLRSLLGESVDALTVNSLEARDAPFLALIVSKLSPMIGNLLERRIVALLGDTPTEHGMTWIRQDPGFPDALLVDASGRPTDAGYEVKAWYALSTEITGRFRESQRLLQGRRVRVVLVAWMMSHIVYGTPRILGVFTADATSLAAARDAHYHDPPTYLIVEPQDTTARTVNLQQTNVNGYRLQDVTEERREEARTLVQESGAAGAEPHSEAAQALARSLMNEFQYRLDTNFAKIDRIDHSEIEAFKREMLAISERGRSLAAWTQLLKNLSSDNAEVRSAAAEVIEAVYGEL